MDANKKGILPALAGLESPGLHEPGWLPDGHNYDVTMRLMLPR